MEDLIRWVRIKVVLVENNPDGSANFYENKKVLHDYDIPRWVYERRKWVVVWRLSYWQCKYPKNIVQFVTGFYDKRTGLELSYKTTHSKLSAAKGMITKLNRFMSEYEFERSKELFWDKENDVEYQKYAVKLSEYKEKEITLQEKYLSEIKEYESQKNMIGK